MIRLSVVLLLALVFPFSLVFIAPTIVAGQSIDSTELSRDLERHTFDLINAYRAGHGLPALIWSPEMAELARQHSRDMATGQVDFGHDGFRERMDKVKSFFPGVRGGGENVFESDERSGMAEFAVASWLKSPPHLHNIRGDYDHSGLGLWRNDKGVYYFTQIFAKTRE